MVIRSDLQRNILKHYCNAIINIKEINKILVNVQVNKCTFSRFEWDIKKWKSDNH